MASGAGASVVRGHCSFDDEAGDDVCAAEFMPGIHRHAQEWWSRVKEREESAVKERGAHQQDISGLWKAEDSAMFGQWVAATAVEYKIRHAAAFNGSTAGEGTRRSV